MAWQAKRVYLGQPGMTSGAIYTVPASVQAFVVKEIIVSNTSTSSSTVTVGIGGTGAAQQIIPATSVPANTTRIYVLSTVLDPGEALHAVQATAGAITLCISGEMRS